METEEEKVERVLSAREMEQVQLLAEKVSTVRDSVDEQWPEVVKAAALAKDCKLALEKEGFSESDALFLIGPLLQYLK